MRTKHNSAEQRNKTLLVVFACEPLLEEFYENKLGHEKRSCWHHIVGGSFAIVGAGLSPTPRAPIGRLIHSNSTDPKTLGWSKVFRHHRRPRIMSQQLVPDHTIIGKKQ
jgi:hypothetical protein